MRPMEADLLQVLLLRGRVLGAREAVKLIQFDVLGRDLGDELLIRGLSLEAGALDPALDGRRVDALDPRHGFWAQAFESLLKGALDFSFRRFEVVEGRPEAVAESPPTFP